MVVTRRKRTTASRSTSSKSSSALTKESRSRRTKEQKQNGVPLKYKISPSSGWWRFVDPWSQLKTTWAQMPTHLQFNPYIQNGYRKITDWKGCLLSLLFVHNETVNILTHGPVAFFTLKNWRQFWPWHSLYDQPYLYGLGISHTIATVVPWVPSCLYHVFMCHHRGPRFYNVLLKIDTLAIWMTEFFGSLTGLAATIWYLPEGLQGLLMGIFNVTSVYGLAKSAKAKTPKQRVLCFAPLLIARVLSIFLRLTPWGGGNPDVFNHVILQDLTSIAGGFIGIARVPEKWFQGRFDYILNSHNLMHLLVILAVWHMNTAANGDVKWIVSQLPKSSTNSSAMTWNTPVYITS